MYCRNCGNKLNDNDTFCGNCGYCVNTENTSSHFDQNAVQYQTVKTDKDKGSGESKTALGAICGVFLGLLGLIVALVFPSESYERSTFMRGWGIAFSVSAIIGILLSFVGCMVLGGMLKALY